MGETTSSVWIRACRDAFMGDTVDVTTGSYCGVGACRNADLGGTVDVTTGPYRGVIDTMGITTSSFLAILRCDATMLVLGGDIVGETTNSLIMSVGNSLLYG